jgi:hypothetical protein
MFLSIIEFQSKSWENFFYFCFFLLSAFIFYGLKQWNISLRRTKQFEEITTKSNIIKYWIFIIICLFGAFICLIKLIFSL